MVSANTVIFSIVLIFSDFGHGLVEIPRLVENKDKLTGEAVTHQVINNLFKTLKINKVNEKPSFIEYNTLHKYFTALTLEGKENVNDIVRLTKENNNNKPSLIETINDVLEEDDSNNANSKNVIDINDDTNLESFIDIFLKDFQLLKHELHVDKVYRNVNTDILGFLKDPNVNFTSNISNIESNLHKSEENDVNSSDIKFWEPSGRRIFKGERTKIKHFPFMATIQIFNNFHCAGSIIKSDLIITASSCLQLAWNNRLFRENPAFLSVRVGSSYYNGGGEVIPILEVYFHPGYNPKTLKNNICLLRLSRQIKFKRRERKVKKIDFDRHDSNLPYNTYGITVVGWGAKEHSPVIGNPWKNIISYAVLDFYPLEDCQDVYSREYVTNKNFCAGFLSRGGGACNRDVGGPGIVDGKLMGVISFGSPLCGMPDTPTVFTKVGYYTDWIEEIMEQNVPVSKKRTTLKPIFDINPVTYIPPKPTTFKIPPITGKTLTPIPISQIDSQLRIIDENVFKDFLGTMFNSKEIKEYKDIFKGDEINAVLVDDHKKDLNKVVSDEFITVTEHQNIEGPHTQILDVSADDESSKSNFDMAYTVMDQENKPYIDDFDNEVSKIIDNVDLERIIKEEVMVSPKIASDIKSDEFVINGTNKSGKYLSENENKVKIISKDKTKNKNDEGLSIPDNIFEDLTRAKDNTDGALPESVLYELLSEVIRDEVQNINFKSFRYFISYNNIIFIFIMSYNLSRKHNLLFIINTDFLK